MRCCIAGALLSVATALDEGPWSLPLTVRTPVEATEICEICGFTTCSGTAYEWLDAVAFLKLRSPARHLLAAWAGTVWDPESLLREIFERWRGPLKVSAPALLHGVLWRASWDHTSSDDPREIFQYLLDLVGGLLEESHLQTLVHGVGHGALYGAHKAKGTPTVVSCQQGPWEPSLEIVLLAEQVCRQFPTPTLGYLCAGGLYHSVKTVESDDDVVPWTPLLDLCMSVTFKGTCIASRVKNALEDEHFRSAVRRLTENSTSPLSVLCPEDRWGKDRSTCYYGYAVALTKHSFVRVEPTCDVPLDFELCRSETDSPLLTAACVQGALHPSVITSSDRPDKCPQDRVAADCYAACATLRDDSNVAMRSAFPVCRAHAVCQPSSAPRPSTSALLNVSIVAPALLATWDSSHTRTN